MARCERALPVFLRFSMRTERTRPVRRRPDPDPTADRPVRPTSGTGIAGDDVTRAATSRSVCRMAQEEDRAHGRGRQAGSSPMTLDVEPATPSRRAASRSCPFSSRSRGRYGQPGRPSQSSKNSVGIQSLGDWSSGEGISYQWPPRMRRWTVRVYPLAISCCSESRRVPRNGMARAPRRSSSVTESVENGCMAVMLRSTRWPDRRLG